MRIGESWNAFRLLGCVSERSALTLDGELSEAVLDLFWEHPASVTRPLESRLRLPHAVGAGNRIGCLQPTGAY